MKKKQQKSIKFTIEMNFKFFFIVKKKYLKKRMENDNKKKKLRNCV